MNFVACVDFLQLCYVFLEVCASQNVGLIFQLKSIEVSCNLFVVIEVIFNMDS